MLYHSNYIIYWEDHHLSPGVLALPYGVSCVGVLGHGRRRHWGRVIFFEDILNYMMISRMIWKKTMIIMYIHACVCVYMFYDYICICSDVVDLIQFWNLLCR